MNNRVRISFGTCLRSLAFTVVLTAGAQSADPLRLRFERLGAQCRHFAAVKILYDRPLRDGSDQQAAEHERLVAELRAAKAERAELAELLKHADAKVRTLALGALFVRENGRDLPLIASLVDDAAPTFPTVGEFHSAMPRLGEPLPETPQTVGDVARAMLTFHLRAAGFALPYEREAAAGFDAYWAERKDREHCASWFAVKMLRATQGTTPLPKERRPVIERVLAEMDALPAEERTWTRLFVLCNAHPSMQDIVPEEELVATAREIGAEVLLKFLDRQVVTADPDLHPDRKQSGVCAHVAVFILRHARELLRPADAETLLDRETAERARPNDLPKLVWPGWAVAAADLQPASAGEILHAAFERFPANRILAAALWRIRGPAEKQFLADWFYTQEQNPSGTHGPAQFLDEARAVGRTDTMDLLSALVADARFELTDGQSLRGMLALASAGRDAPLVSYDELSQAQNAPDRMVTFSQWRNLLRRECGLPEGPTIAFPKAQRVLTTPAFSVKLAGAPAQLIFSPDGKQFAALSHSGGKSVQSWKSATGKPGPALAKLLWASWIAFDKTGRRLTLLTHHGTATDWDLSKQQPVRETKLTGIPSSGIEGVFSADPALTRLAVITVNTISCFDLQNGPALWSKRREDESGAGGFAALSPDARQLATGGRGRAVKVFDAAAGELIRKLDGHAGIALGAAYSPDDRLLATTTSEGALTLWDTATGEMRKRFVYPMQYSGAPAFSGDGRRLAIASGTVGVFDVQTGVLRWEVRPSLRGHLITAFALSPDGRLLLVGGGDPARIHAWRLE